MRIKKLFKTESEYLDYAWHFINFDPNKIWREEDLPKLQSFFDFISDPNKKPLFQDYKESFEFYEKCKREYADGLFEIRDSIRGFRVEDLEEFFFLEPPAMDCYDYDKDGNEIDEDGNIIPPISRGTIKINEEFKGEIKFPLYFVGWIDNGFDRAGDFRMAYSEFVCLGEFNDAR
jgi:hypothetical protein